MSGVESNHRLVHLDLKGAPPRVEYYEQVFPLFKKWGATGLLMEYEDMFPYSGELEDIACSHAYRREAIDRILQLADECGLIVIPLVQTYGHFEFVLKHEKFRSLREMPDYPMALCPCNPDSLVAVSMMIDQVMELHPGIRWFHIGADEVYHIGMCERCRKKMATENITSQQLFFTHMRAVLMRFKLKYPGVTAIMWDDMLRMVDLPTLLESGLGNLVEPMVWHYLTSFLLPPDLWDRLSKVFPNIWVASAFKGATGACMYATNICYHRDNHLTWLSVMNREKLKFQCIRGMAITGWQRYDHYAVLCELLPQALPCLAICLNIINKGIFTADIHRDVSTQLRFLSVIPLNPFQGREVPPCEFPGSDVYCGMLEFVQLEVSFEEFMHSESRVTWMNQYNIQRNFISLLHIEPMIVQATGLLENLTQLKSRLQKSLSHIYFADTVEEWLYVHLNPKIKRLSEIIESVQNHKIVGNKVKDLETSYIH
ncbi:hypothetical protein ScPMuIL_004849 [Solemya velum]